MGLRVDVKRLIDAVTNHCVEYVQNDMQLEILGLEYRLQDVKSINLRHLTALVAVGGNLGLYIAFSFDENVIRHLFEQFTEGLDLGGDEEETQSYIDETAGEILNTVIGNALADMPRGESVISLTPPVVLGEAKSIIRHKNAYFYTADITMTPGRMSVMCIGPQSIFDYDLEYLESKER